MNNQERITGHYSGPISKEKFSRNFKAIEASLTDSFLMDQCLSSVAEGLPDNADLNLLDIGSGSGEFLFALADVNQSPLLQGVIKRKNLHLRAIGLTDCLSADLFNQPANDERIKFSGEIRNYYYTITGSQTLAAFLEGKGLPLFHFINASQFFLYQSSRVCIDTMELLIDRLAKDGKFFAAGIGIYGGPLPAFTGESAKQLRESGHHSLAEVLNLFTTSDALCHVQIPSLTLRKDWQLLISTLKMLEDRLRKGGWVNNGTAVDQQVSFLLNKYFQAKRGRKYIAHAYPNRCFQEIDPENLLLVNDTRAREALRFYVLYHEAVTKMRQKQYAKQVMAKQTYLEQLKQRNDTVVQILKTLLNDTDSHIDALLITKK